MDPSRSGESGHALLLALLVLILMAAASSLLSGALIQRMKLTHEARDRTQVLALADAALAETLARMVIDPGFGGIEEREFGSGSFSSRVAYRGANKGTILVGSRHGRVDLFVAADFVLSPNRPPRVVDWRRVVRP